MKENHLWEILSDRLLDAVFTSRHFTEYEGEVRLFIALMISAGKDRDWLFFELEPFSWSCYIFNLNAEKVSTAIYNLAHAIDNDPEQIQSLLDFLEEEEL